jgi:hypothetical protein
MDHFIIDGFDFGIDSERSSVVIKDSILTLRLVGKQSVLSELAMDQKHPWHWLIHPPFLFVVGLPCHIAPDGAFEHKLTKGEVEDYDISLHIMGKHCHVLPCHVSMKGKVVRVAGKVHGVRKTALDFDCESATVNEDP